MPVKEILAKKNYVDSNLNNVVRNNNGVVSIPNSVVELSTKVVTTTTEDPETHEQVTTNETVRESWLEKTRLHVEDPNNSAEAEYGATGITLGGNTITGITNNPSGNSSTLAVSQRALSNFKQVEANPVGTPTADLTTIKIDNTIYNLDAGTNVEANPSGQATETLNKIKIENIIYDFAASGSGANIVDVLYQSSTLSAVTNLTHSIFNYDFVIVNFTVEPPDTAFKGSHVIIPIDMAINDYIGVMVNGYNYWFQLTANNQFTQASSHHYITSVLGIKLGCGNASKTLLYSGTTDVQTINLPKSLDDFDLIYLQAASTGSTPYRATATYDPLLLSNSDEIGVSDDADYIWYTISNNKQTLTKALGRNYYLAEVVGIKYGAEYDVSTIDFTQLSASQIADLKTVLGIN